MEGKKLQKFEYLENEKSFFDKIKNNFHSFLKSIIWWKNRNLIKNSGWSSERNTENIKSHLYFDKESDYSEENIFENELHHSTP